MEIPGKREDLDEFLSDIDKVKQMMATPGEFKEFIRAYARTMPEEVFIPADSYEALLLDLGSELYHLAERTRTLLFLYRKYKSDDAPATD